MKPIRPTVLLAAALTALALRRRQARQLRRRLRQGPDIHANKTGAGTIAATFRKALGKVAR